MADKKSVGHAYNIDFLNVVFAASSIFLFVSMLWMVWDDYDREWKGYQRRFVQLEMEVTRTSLEAANQEVDTRVISELEAKRADAEARLEVQTEQISILQEELDGVDVQLELANQLYQFAKANYDVDKYTFEVERGEDPDAPGLDETQATIEAQYAEWLELGLEVEQLTAERNGLRDEIADFSREVTDLDEEIGALTGESRRLSERLGAIEPNFRDEFLLNAPLLDFMAPTITVQQVVTPNILDDVNFTRVPKMDRCMTCHLAIDREGYEDYPQPFRTHSNLSTYVGSASPHPLEQTGCTVCHEGMGQSVSFRDVAHTPVSEEQLHAWEEAYNWEEPHLWDYPMLPSGMAEASCAKCHDNEI
ncbi:MAG: hypothetical protein VX273_00500, partial [Acidobacteriota bacterium]|nr:hypothetical protein [Acidobacteriota bacterium]